MPPWRTRKDKRKYKKRDRIGAGRDSGRENDARRRILRVPGKAFIGRETFTAADIEDIINFNRRRVQQRGEGFEVDRDKLDKIIKRLDKLESVQDPGTRIIKKAALLLGGIAFIQPFYDGNRETALASTLYFLERNGFTLPATPAVRTKIYDVLTRTAQKYGMDRPDYVEIENLLAKSVVSHRV